VNLKNGIFSAEGDFERELALPTTIGALWGAATKPEKVTVRYRGMVHGRAVVGDVTRGSGERRTSLLYSGETITKFLMVLNDETTELRAMELSPGGNAEFSRIRKSTALETNGADIVAS
jgi:hypothetical protein